MKISIPTLFLFLTSLLCCSLVSCTSSADENAMRPVGVTTSTRTSQPIQAMVVGGMQKAGQQGSGITNEDFKQALEASLIASSLFSHAGSGGYHLEAFIADIDRPAMGFSMTVELEVGYTLRKGGSTIWRKSIHSTYTAPVSEAFAGVVRVRKATEGAARANIEQLIRQLDNKL